jgi:hypothetical protein
MRPVNSGSCGPGSGPRCLDYEFLCPDFIWRFIFSFFCLLQKFVCEKGKERKYQHIRKKPFGILIKTRISSRQIKLQINIEIFKKRRIFSAVSVSATNYFECDFCSCVNLCICYHVFFFWFRRVGCCVVLPSSLGTDSGLIKDCPRWVLLISGS